MRKTLFISALLLPTAAMGQYYHESEDTLTSVIIAILFAIIIFILIRELVCWYYKINKSIKNQEEIIRLLKKIAGEPEEPKE